MSDAADFVVVVTLPGTEEHFVRNVSGLVTLGRGEDCDLVLAHPLVSRHHVTIELLGSQFKIRDLGSRNGTHVNGAPLSDSVVTVEGQVALQVGPYLVSVSRTTPGETTVLAGSPNAFPRVVLDRGTHSLLVDGTAVLYRLAGLEYRLLDALAASAPSLVATVPLGDAIWGKDQWDSYMLHNLVRRVRRKLEEAGLPAEDLLVSVPSVGYRIA